LDCIHLPGETTVNKMSGEGKPEIENVAPEENESSEAAGIEKV
jgi:hypothetical protein